MFVRMENYFTATAAICIAATAVAAIATPATASMTATAI
jgi:hypothetical protein